LYIQITILAAQFGLSAGCHDNSRANLPTLAGRENVINASFQIHFSKTSLGPNGAYFGCSGTLMNRDVDQDELGFYFSTARHCIHTSNIDPGAPDIDFDVDHVFIFHYESPGNNSDGTPISNRGQSHQSTWLGDVGAEYYHLSKVELVDEAYFGDYALLRMVTPLPPHFNFYFAGWRSSAFFPEGFLTSPGGSCNELNPLAVAHHPKGDIKKLAGARAIHNPTPPVLVGCETITTLIDFLFGWIWGHQWSTQVICNYTEYPWYIVPYWCEGGMEEGSSGAGLMDQNNKLTGVLSWQPGYCNNATNSNFGKFKNVYPRTAIRNTLNPSHNFDNELWGMDGRKIACYANLDLPGGHQQHTYYFPANHYQTENTITLQAQERINVVAPITILTDASYVFKAGSAINLNTVVDIHPGATFVAEIEGCTVSGVAGGSSRSAPVFTKLPRRMTLDREFVEGMREPAAPGPFLEVFPNPGSDLIGFHSDMQKAQRVELIGMDGKVWYDGPATKMQLDISGIVNGMYVVRLRDAGGEYRTTRFIKQ